MTPYELASEYAQHTSRCIFLTGKAGTGKTTFLRQLYRSTGKQIAVVAPTGVAAINAEGVTIHSFFQLPPQIFLPTDAARRALLAEMQVRKHKAETIRRLELLVIDEISMVRADLLDAIDAVLRHFKRMPTLPFGGVQVLMIGDLFQLSPVAREADWQILREYYQGPYFFQAQVFREIHPVYIELDHVFRQQDERFVSLLNEVRNNCLSAASRELLNTRVDIHYQRQEDDIILSTHNRKVDAINTSELAALPGREYRFEADVQGTFPESSYPIDATLTLKQGARVMFVKSDPSADHAFYNGKLGVVRLVTKQGVLVESEGEEIEVPLVTWENIRYSSTHGTDLLETEVIGTFTQYPLRLAWAITIHKSQGLTFDHVVIDAADAFAAGQVYVALSRCRTLEGITLLSPIPPSSLTNAQEVLRYTDTQPSIDEVGQGLSTATRDYLLILLTSLYDFRSPIRQVERLRRLSGGEAAFTDETPAYLKALFDALFALQDVAERFQQQIRRLILTESSDLQERLAAASAYFTPLLKGLQDTLSQSPCRTGNKEAAADFTDEICDLYINLNRQAYLMRHMGKSVSIADWFDAKRRYLIPPVGISASPVKVKSVAKTKGKKKSTKKGKFA